MIGSLQAMEAIKLILGIGETPIGKLLIYDALRTSFRSLKLSRDPACRLCGEKPTIASVLNSETTANPSCQINDPTMQTITAAELKDRLDSGNLNALLIDVREEAEWQVVNIPQAKLVPLQTIPSHAPNLPKDVEIIIHCKAGMRSARACEYLMSIGFENVTNVEGGMDAFQKL
jgi:adenylyltransferase/sulfurtransferase